MYLLIVAFSQQKFPPIAVFRTVMASKKRKAKKSRPEVTQPVESRATEALTVAWTVTLTTLLFCNLATIGAHYLAAWNPDAKKMLVLREMLLFASAIIGAISLILLPFVQRFRRIPPPRGVVVFGICLAIAPILVMILRSAG